MDQTILCALIGTGGALFGVLCGSAFTYMTTRMTLQNANRESRLEKTRSAYGEFLVAYNTFITSVQLRRLSGVDPAKAAEDIKAFRIAFTAAILYAPDDTADAIRELFQACTLFAEGKATAAALTEPYITVERYFRRELSANDKYRGRRNHR